MSGLTYQGKTTIVSGNVIRKAGQCIAWYGSRGPPSDSCVD
jgi:hypothetical protein